MDDSIIHGIIQKMAQQFQVFALVSNKLSGPRFIKHCENGSQTLTLEESKENSS